MRIMALSSLTVFLLLAISSLSASFTVPSCPNDTEEIVVGDYVYTGSNMNTLVCPRTDGENAGRWKYTTTINGTIFSSTEFTPTQVCTLSTTPSETALIVANSFFSNLVSGSLVFMLNNVTITFEYGSTGIFIFNSSNITFTEGQTSGTIFFFVYGGTFPSSKRFVRIDDSGGLEDQNSFSSLELTTLLSCQENIQGIKPRVFSVTISNPLDVTGSGLYSAIVIFNGMTYSANVTITVLDNPSNMSSFTITPSPTLLPSSPSITTTVSITTSPTTTESQGSGTLIVYVLVGVLGLVAIAVVIIGVTLCIVCYCRIKAKRAGQVYENRDRDIVIVPQGYNDDKKDTKNDDPSIPRGDSTSSNKPLILGRRLSSTSSAQSTSKQEDYTAVYCSHRHSHIGKLYKEKHKCLLVSTEDDIYKSLEDKLCVEILMFADPSDEVVIAVISRGMHMNREKLKWWQFVSEDKTPDHVIEIEGFRIIQVEGDPNEWDTHQLGLLKTDYPPLSSINGVIHETNQSKGGGSSPRDRGEGHDETDAGKNQSEYGELLQEQKKTNELHKETNKLQKTTNELLVDLVLVNKESKEVEKDILEETCEQKKIQRDQLALTEQQAVVTAGEPEGP